MTEFETETDGQLETLEDDRYQVRFVRRLPHPPEKVWRALTEDEHLEAWFPTTIEGERTAGAALRFSFREHEIPPFDGTMLACDPPRLLEFLWGPDQLRFELAPDGDGTLLTMCDLVDPDEMGKAARDASGWHIALNRLTYELDHHGDGTQNPWAADDVFEPINARYIELFPAEASTVGPPQEYYDTIDRKKP
jgi:uncharacterized protein YndB with AHSA1/START domain